MKIIWITPELPYPANTGGRIVMMKRIEHLAKYASIYLFSIIDHNNEREFIEDLKKNCCDVKLYCRKDYRLINLYRTFKDPYPCASRYNPLMKTDIRECFEKENIDFIFVDFPQMLDNIDPFLLGKAKIVVNQHNIEWKALKSMGNSNRSIIKNLVYKIESFRLRRKEERLYKKINPIFQTFVSTEDEIYFKEHHKIKNTLLLPIGTEIVAELPDSNYKTKKTILFVGKMSYPANREAVQWFYHNVYKELKILVPNCEWFIVGKDPDPSIVNLMNLDKSIIVTGTVETVTNYYRNADVVIIPLLNGGGVKVKLIEALSFGKIIITTPKGVEGTTFRNNEEVLVANNKNEFIERCSDALNNTEKYKNISKNGKQLITKKFTWEAIIKDFYHELLKYKK